MSCHSGGALADQVAVFINDTITNILVSITRTLPK